MRFLSCTGSGAFSRTGLAALALVSLLIAGACGRAAPVDAAGGGAALLNRLLSAGRVEVFAPGGDVEDACLRSISFADPERDGLTLRVLPQAAAGDDGAARIVLGAPSEPAVRELVQALGVEVLGPASFRWGELDLDQPTDGLVATFQDPARPGLPVTVVLANERGALAAYACGDGAELAPGWRPCARAFREGRVIAEAELELDGALVERTLDVRGGRGLPRLRPVELDGAEGVQCRAAATLPAPRVVDYVERLLAARERLAAWAGDGPHDHSEADELALYLYASPSEMARAVDGVELSWVHPLQGRVYALLGPDGLDDGGAAGALAAAYERLGVPAHPWLADAVAVEAADAWWGRPLERWGARLAHGGLVPDVEELLDARADERRSQHALVPLRALLVRHLRRTEGDAFLRGLWGGSVELPPRGDLAAGFAAWLEELAAAHAVELDPERIAGRLATVAALLSGPFVAGVGMASPSFAADPLARAEDGGEAVAAAAALGARAVSVETFAAAYANRPAVGCAGSGASRLGPLEGDVTLAWTLARARELDLFTVLKPSLLEAPGSTYAGNLLRGTEEDWVRFFVDTARFLEHFGLLAELLDVDLLSVGAGIQVAVGLDPSSQRAGPEEAGWKLTGWRDALGVARAAYDGALTYATVWPEKTSDVSLWERLDVVALDVFLDPPADLRGTDLDAWLGKELSNVLSDVAGAHAREGKPVLLTAVGFQADGVGGVGGSGGRQERSFRMLARRLDRALAPPRAEGLAGAFLWRWETDGRVGDVDYVFRGRPAETEALKVLELR